MYSVQTVLVDVGVTPVIGNPSRNLINTDQTNVWLFTSPSARAIYTKQGKLAILERDIRTYAMYEGKWSSDELQFRQEIGHLIKSNHLIPRPAFGHISPHPIIYRAIREGRIRIHGMNFSFRIGDDIVFAPWIERLNHPGLIGPLRIDRLNTTTRYTLCYEEFPQMKELSPKDLDVLHKIVYTSLNRRGSYHH